MISLKRKIIKSTLIVTFCTTLVVFLIVLIIVLAVHASIHDTVIALLGSIGLTIAIGLLFCPVFFWFVFTQLPNVENKTDGIYKTQENGRLKTSIEYELSIDEVIAFYIFNRERSPTLGKVRRIMRLLLLITFAIEVSIVIILLTVLGQDELPIAIFVAVLALFTSLYYVLFNILSRKVIKRKMVRSHLQKPNKLVGKHLLSISPDTISDSTDGGESSTSWNIVEYVASTEQYLFIAVRSSEPYIVPGNVFPDDALFNQFIKLVEKYHKAHRPSAGM